MFSKKVPSGFCRVCCWIPLALLFVLISACHNTTDKIDIVSKTDLPLNLRASNVTLCIDTGGTVYLASVKNEHLELLTMQDANCISLGIAPVDLQNRHIDWIGGQDGSLNIAASSSTREVSSKSQIEPINDDKELKIITYMLGSWHSEVIARKFFAISTATIKDAKERMVIAYSTMATPDQFVIARNEGKKWIEKANAKPFQLLTAIDVKTDGSIYVLASRVTSTGKKRPDYDVVLYKYSEDLEMIIEDALEIEVNSFTYGSGVKDMKIAPNGTIGIVYFNYEYDLVYAYNSSGKWENEIIQRGATEHFHNDATWGLFAYGAAASLNYDENSIPHIVCSIVPIGKREYGVYYFRKIGKAWTNDMIAFKAALSDRKSAALDQNERMHIVYYGWYSDSYVSGPFTYCVAHPLSK